MFENQFKPVSLFFQATSAAAAALRSLKVTAEQVEGAKRQMLQEAADIESSSVLRAQDIALMGLNLGSVWSQDEIVAAINAVTVGDVQVKKINVHIGK